MTAPFSVVRSFHPTVVVRALADAEKVYERLFGALSYPPETHGHDDDPDYVNDYESCVMIRDVWFATVAPEKCIDGGFQSLPTPTGPGLVGYGFYVDDVDAAFAACRERGWRLTTPHGTPLPGGDILTFGPYRLFCTAPDATGLRYTVFQDTELSVDPRTHAGWTLSPPATDDPVGAIRSSHHTVLTRSPPRELEFVVDVLGGTVICEGRNELIGSDSTYVSLADAIIEYAVPDAGTAARAAWAYNIPGDTFYAINWLVEDLERAEAHLSAEGVRTGARTAQSFLTDPATSLLPWGFTDTPVPGDPRDGGAR